MLKMSFSFKGFGSPNLLLLSFYSTHIPTCLSARPPVRLSRAKYSCPFVAFYLYHSLSLSFISLVSDMLSFVRVSCPFVRFVFQGCFPSNNETTMTFSFHLENLENVQVLSFTNAYFAESLPLSMSSIHHGYLFHFEEEDSLYHPPATK